MYCALFSQQCAKGEFVNINCSSVIRIFSKQYFVVHFLFLENNNLKEDIADANVTSVEHTRHVSSCWDLKDVPDSLRF